ncbi:MAG: hypothetical protein KDC54_16115, partial [Lewinella sp.]|nr:hypothetical protein [Lewinella sp.]
MQKLPLIFLISLLCSALSGQISLDASYFPVPGDTLRTATALNPGMIDIGVAGSGQTWDFSMLQADATLERAVTAASAGQGSSAFPNATLLVEQTNGAEGYYQSTENSFSIIGYFGVDPLGQGFEVSAPFSPAYVERWAPLDFLDLNGNDAALQFDAAVEDIPGNLFDGLEIVPDSIRLAVSTDRTDLVDAWGTMTLPGGASYEVLRERRLEYREVLLYAKVGGLPWFDITTIALAALPIDELGRDTVMSYYFWSSEAKEPVAVVTSDATGENIQSVTYKYDAEVVSATTSNRPPAEPSVRAYPN